MTDTLVAGGRIEIRGFGSFEIRSFDGYSGRNPKTGKLVNVKPKKSPFFKVGKELRVRIYQKTYQSASESSTGRCGPDNR
jgi:integration host factor subunit beta